MDDSEPMGSTTASDAAPESGSTSASRAGCWIVLLRTVLAVPAGGIVGLLVAAGIIHFDDDSLPLHSLPFESSAWRSAPEPRGLEERPLRQRMAANLVEVVLVPGTDRVRVRELLGPPFRWPIFDVSPWFGPEDEAWWLGPPVGEFSGENQWLVLDFDTADTLVSARVLGEDAATRTTP